jgi:hypothetical protein
LLIRVKGAGQFWPEVSENNEAKHLAIATNFAFDAKISLTHTGQTSRNCNCR